jgi:hypothetical protein
MAKTREDRRAFWRGHVQAWRQSGQRRDAYCAEHGLNAQTFNVWVGRLREEFRSGGSTGSDRQRRGRAVREAGEETGTATFIPVEVSAAQTDEVPVATETAAAAPLEVEVGGVTVRVPADAATETLERVIAAARRAS